MFPETVSKGNMIVFENPIREIRGIIILGIMPIRKLVGPAVTLTVTGTGKPRKRNTLIFKI